MKHKEGMVDYGVNVLTGKVEDMTKLGIIEPLKVKEQLLKTCTEVASMILRIDDIFDTRDTKKPEK